MSSLSWLQHIRESLVILSISIENNTHLDMYTTAFSYDFPKLETLTLVNNGLKEVPKVSLVVDTLCSLYLSRNRITSLKNIYNIRFPKLRTLELQTNRIRLISIDKLEMPQLTSLLLYENLIKTVEPIAGILGGSSGRCGQLYVSFNINPWHCDTSMMWLKECDKMPGINPTYYRGPSCRVYFIDYPNLVCKTPEHLEGESIWTAGNIVNFSLGIELTMEECLTVVCQDLT